MINDPIKSAFSVSKLDKSGMFNQVISGGMLQGEHKVYIKSVIYTNPVTVVLWSDGTKTLSKCVDGDPYNKEAGLSICVLKKLIGGMKVMELLDEWAPEDKSIVTLKDVRKSRR